MMNRSRGMWLLTASVVAGGLLWLGLSGIVPGSGRLMFLLQREGEVVATRGAILASPRTPLVLQVVSSNDPVYLDRKRAVRAVITNRGNAPVTLVMPGDGSYDGWRTPLVAWSVVRAGDPTAAHAPPPVFPQFRKCGNLDPLRWSDIFTLRSGQSRVVSAAPDFPGPGQYRVVFYYRNIPRRTGWDDEGTNPVLKQVRHSTPCWLTSNELTVNVR